MDTSAWVFVGGYSLLIISLNFTDILANYLVGDREKPPINTLADVFNRARSPKFGCSLNLYPYFVYMSSNSSGQSANLRSLARALLLDNIRMKWDQVGQGICIIYE